MGNDNSKKEIDTSLEISYINHPRFQKVQIIENKTGQKFIQTIIPVHSQRQIKEWENLQKNLQGIQKQNILLNHSYQFQKQGMCGSSGTVKILYENYPFLLSDQIANRKGLSKKFEETQIWYLLYTIVATSKDFQNKNLKVGDIRPQNIFINEDGQVKLSNIYSWPSEQTNYFKSLLNHQITYLAPQELKDLAVLKNQSTSNPSIAQSFSIGITILDAGLLLDNTKLYQISTNSAKFNDQNFKSILQQWKNSSYSDFLKNTVLDLIELQPKNRKKPSEIFKILLPYQQDIKNLVEFNPTHLQDKRTQNYNNMPNTHVHQQGPFLVKSQFVNDYQPQRVQYVNSQPLQNFTNIQSTFPQVQFQPTGYQQQYAQMPVYQRQFITSNPPPNIQTNITNLGTTFSNQIPQHYAQIHQQKIPFGYFAEGNNRSSSQIIEGNQFSRPYSIPYNPPVYQKVSSGNIQTNYITGPFPQLQVPNQPGKIEIKPNFAQGYERAVLENNPINNISIGQTGKPRQI